MESNDKSKNRLIHFGAIIFLICAIIVFIGVVLISFDVDVNLGELFSNKEELKVTVMNNYGETLYIECAIYCDIGEVGPSMKIYKGEGLESKSTYVFTHEYEKSDKIIKIDIAVYNSSNYDDIPNNGIVDKRAYEYYEFSNTPYNLLGVISESGDTITITRLSES